MKWTKKEKELLEGYVLADDSETAEESIQHAQYMLYMEGNHPEFKERSISACRTMMQKICKEKVDNDIYVTDLRNIKVPMTMLNCSRLLELVDYLNSYGYSLGSGHENLTLEKNIVGEEHCYILTLCPYLGHSNQIINFYKYEK